MKNPTVSIAMDTSWIPYAMNGERSGEIRGIIPGILDIVAQRTGLKVKYVAKESYAEAIATLKKGDTMLVSGIANDPKMANKNNVNVTKPYIDIGYTAITKAKIEDLYTMGASHRVAVCKGSYATMAMKEKMPSYKFMEYNSDEECLRAVKNEKVDVALVATYAAEYYKGKHEFASLKSIVINDFSWGLSFGVGKQCDPRLTSILNKGIASLNENDVNQAIYESLIESANNFQTMADWIYAKPFVSIGISSIILILILLAIFLLINRHRKGKELQKVRKLNEELIVANRAKQDFMSQMSHELRTPMNAIVGMAELGLQEGKEKRSLHYFDKINASGQYLLGLINNLLDMNKLQQNKIQLKEELIDGRKFIKDVIDIIHPVIAQRNIKLVTNFKNFEHQYLYCDEIRMRQIFINLLSNAIKFSERGSTVMWSCEELRVEEDKAYYKIQCIDHGCGMSEEFMKKIFEPFTQEKNSHSDENSSTGLGLAITKRIVDTMGGKIEVSSKLGEGSEFTVYFACRIASEEAFKKTENCGNEQLRGKRALIVEDHPLNAEIEEKLLKKMEMVVFRADNGEKGVEAFLQFEPGFIDVILMDIRMPVMDGIEATKKIRALNRSDAKKVPIIVTTANTFEEGMEKANEVGITDYLTKPIMPKALYQMLREYLN